MNIKKDLMKKVIRFEQKLVDRAYEKYGLTDDVLDMQIKVNEQRNKYNLNDSDEEFVQ